MDTVTLSNDSFPESNDKHKEQSIQAINSLLNVLEQGTFPSELSNDVETAKSFAMVLLLQLTDPAKLDAMLTKLKTKEAEKTLAKKALQEQSLELAKKRFDENLNKKGLN